MLSPARAAAFDILMRVEQGAFADELLHSERLKGLSPLDRALTTELVMGVLRWRSVLDDILQSSSKEELRKLDLEVLTALRLGVYQLSFLTRVPEHAAVSDSVELVKRARKRSAVPFANAVLRNVLRQPAQDIAAQTDAHPAWLVQRWRRVYEDATSRICPYDQVPPPTALRLHDPAVEGELVAEGVALAPGELLRGARRVLSGEVAKTRAFTQHRLHIQDEASQLVALLVGSGRRLLDCCAAPGGKTALLAERNPQALVVAAELHPRRAQLLRRLVRAPNVRVLAARAEQLPLAADFDCILADVPCSGTGTLARNPEIKWRLKPEDLADLHRRQVAILRGALERLAPGGKLVYSTCSLEPEENHQVVEEVVLGRSDLGFVPCREELDRLKQSGELIFDDLPSLLDGLYLRTIPGVHPCDGFFAAVIQRR